MSRKVTASLVSLVGSIATVAICATSTSAANGAPQPTAQPRGDLGQWEQQFLGRPYDKDPLDKRIQRLELLLFGSTQDGTLTERLEHIHSAIASRQAVHLSKASVAGSLAQLEQKILKKTFPAEKVDARLSRLETKLFGKASPGMSAGERVDRLKRTIGLGEPPPIADSQQQDMLIRPWPHGFDSMPVPFGYQSMDPNDLNQQMSEMMRQFNQQLRQLHRMPEGEPVIPSIPRFTEPDQTAPTPRLPNIRKQEQLPPYMDPNSI
jgi:hypothetical protein